MNLKQVENRFIKDKYKVQTQFDHSKLETQEWNTIEIFDTKKSTGNEGYTDCSWIIIAFIDEIKKIVYLSAHHDGLIIDGIERIHLHCCNLHGGVVMRIHNARITHRGGDFWVECRKENAEGVKK